MAETVSTFTKSLIYHIHQIRTYVDAHIGASIVEEMINHVKKKFFNPWGQKGIKTFVADMVYLTLLKDMDDVGYNRLKMTEGLSYTISNKSIAHNVKGVRAALYDWALDKIRITTYSQWKKAARKAGLTALISDANLLLDSTDCPIEHTADRGPLSEHWSGKINCAGRRFMVISDFDGRILQAWGGYSPKVYDSHFIHYAQQTFVTTRRDAIFLADNHFSTANEFSVFPRFYFNTAESADTRDVQNVDTLEGLTTEGKKQLKQNRAIKGARGRVERPFADTKNMFKSLTEKWAEELEQLTFTFFIACAIHNLKLGI